MIFIIAKVIKLCELEGKIFQSVHGDNIQAVVDLSFYPCDLLSRTVRARLFAVEWIGSIN